MAESISTIVSSGKWIVLRVCALVACAAIFHTGQPAEAQVPVQHPEGLVHGFLELRTLEGAILADGDLIQNVRGDRVTTRLIFHFKDGSTYDDTAIFSQRGSFRLLSDHLIEKGPAFEHPMDVLVNGPTGEVTVTYTEGGKEKAETERLRLPSDIANGIVPVLLKNIRPGTPEIKLSMVVATPKPKLVKLGITPQGEETFSTGSATHKAMHYVVKAELGGLTGAFASLLGKEPPDTHVWILEGEAPAFIKMEGPLALGGPVWRMELVSPTWPRTQENKPAEKK
ncbi:MAG TPA: hypothetical protein VKL40_02585 [Candidatus Angelobacter sp.]|nr:hypothetical protein [Candidatus Angelobacter sp.]